MSSASEKYEFLSSEWLASVRRVVDEFLAEHDSAAVNHTISEELTDPPTGRPLPPEGTVGWFIRVRNGVAEIGGLPLRGADLRVVADYATHHDSSVRIWAGDPTAMAKSKEIRERAAVDGRLHTEGDVGNRTSGDP